MVVGAAHTNARKGYWIRVEGGMGNNCESSQSIMSMPNLEMDLRTGGWGEWHVEADVTLHYLGVIETKGMGKPRNLVRRPLWYAIAEYE